MIDASRKPSKKALAKVQRWKSNFLDLSNRNNQLNFQPNNQRYIEIITPSSSNLFKILAVLGQTGTFPPVFKKKGKRTRKKKSTSTTEPFEPAPEPKLSPEFKEEHRLALNKAKENARLTEIFTELTDNALETRIKKLILKTQEYEEERGINILYITFGLLKWRERGETTFNNSPILFIPAKLTLKPLELKLLDDEVIVNPALRQKLLGERIKLPKFGYEFDSRAFFKYFINVKDEISLEPSWEVEERSFIGTFTFSKAPLFEDIDDHQDIILNHPIVRAIAEEKGFAEKVENLPEKEILGDSLNPINSYSVLDCDSSQMEAVQYAKSGVSCIIQGPPGTGKSQAITNIIAESLAIGKKILFVAQKRAALDVVKKRLDKCGIGDFCLQLHSQNTNKAQLLKQIEKSMEFNLEIPKIRLGKFQQLSLIREKLNEYVETINRPFGVMNYSLYQIMGHVLKLGDIPLLDAEISDPKLYTEEQFVKAKDILNQLELFRNTIENYNDNPWRYSQIVSPLILSPELHMVLRKLLSGFKKANIDLQEALRNFHLKFAPDFLHNLGQVSQWQRTIKLSRYWADVLRNLYDIWLDLDTTHDKLTEYFNLGTVIDFEQINFDSMKQLTLAYEKDIPEGKNFKKFLLTNLNIYIQKVEDFNNRIVVFNLKSKLKSIQNERDLMRIMKFLNTYNEKALILDVDTLVARFTIDYTSRQQRKTEAYQEDKDSILSCLQNPDPKSNVVGHLNVIKSFQDEYGKPYTTSIEFLQKISLELNQVINEWDSFRDLDEFFYPLLSISVIPSEFQQQLWDKNHIFATQWYENLPYLNDWFEVQVKKHHLYDVGLGDFFEKLTNQKFNEIVKNPENPNEKITNKILYEKLFEKVFYSTWYEDIHDSLPPIANFNKKFHEKEIEKFRLVDSETLILNQGRLQSILFSQRPKSDLEISDLLLAQSGYIKRELKKKRNVKPLRHTFIEAKEYISLLKPCFLMSPLSIANYLPLEEYEQYFDMVIFDEASQVTPEDAIGAIIRGKSLVVVGDSEQLPPTNFFTAKASNDDDFGDPDLDVDVQSMESLLDECTGIGFREKMLKFHYRSKKEGLIAFSNMNYYNGGLFSFPDIGTQISKKASEETEKNEASEMPSEFEKTSELENYGEINVLKAIDFKYISEGRKKKGKNVIEASYVAKAIINHYKSNRKYKTNYSLGVVAFSQTQQETIKQALDKLFKTESDHEIEALLYSDEEEHLFIKNLESVQGDERDFIFFSIGYGKDENGKMGLNFGPLNRSGGYRRLNVAITRARYHVKIFASFLPSEIPLEKVNARGLKDLIGYMKFARFGILGKKRSVLAIENSEKEESFEADVERTLESHGFIVHTKIGTSDFKIDLAVVDPNNTTQYILGIELDGGSYKDADNARDRDRIRNNVLKLLGWNMLHIWPTEWFNNKDKIITQIKRLINKIKKKEISIPVNANG